MTSHVRWSDGRFIGRSVIVSQKLAVNYTSMLLSAATVSFNTDYNDVGDHVADGWRECAGVHGDPPRRQHRHLHHRRRGGDH